MTRLASSHTANPVAFSTNKLSSGAPDPEYLARKTSIALTNEFFATSSPIAAQAQPSSPRGIVDLSLYVDESAEGTLTHTHTLHRDQTSDQNTWNKNKLHIAKDNGVKCSCSEHTGKEMFNQTYPMSVNYLWEIIFGNTEFTRKYWESRKFLDMSMGNGWQAVAAKPGIVVRRVSFTVDLGSVGRAKSVDEQVGINLRKQESLISFPYEFYFIQEGEEDEEEEKTVEHCLEN